MNASALRIFRQCSAAVAAGMIFFSHQADAALTPLPGTVTVLQANYLPDMIAFKISTGDATCGPNKWLTFEEGSADTRKAVYATLLANLLSGRPAYVWYESTNHNSVSWGSDACRIIHVGTY